MNQQTELPAVSPVETSSAPLVKIIGVGNAGVALLGSLDSAEFAGAQFAAVNTDASAFASASIPVSIHLETKLLRDGQSKRVPPAGDEDDLDPKRVRAAQSSQVNWRDLKLGIEQGAVDIDGNEAERISGHR